MLDPELDTCVQWQCTEETTNTRENMSHEKASYKDFCIWLRCVSDAEPSYSRYDALSVSDLIAIKSEAARIRRIDAEYALSTAKARAAAARVK